MLRHALGLSAWKQFRDSRWSLRVNPSSGNLHPTEAYVVSRSLDGSPAGEVYHYDAKRHLLEERCVFELPASAATPHPDDDGWLVALTSIHWREAWKYGERAFRYCQHDLGHAIAAVRLAAALAGREARLVADWSHAEIAALTGIDRDDDFFEAEREEPGCIVAVGERAFAEHQMQWLEAVRNGRWTGRASQLSEDHVVWTFIDDVARATRDPGRATPSVANSPIADADTPRLNPRLDRSLVLQRRSAVSLDPRASIAAAAVFEMLARVMPSSGAPFDALWWDARIHLALFIHRVDGLEPGLYMLVRNPAALERVRAACGREFLWEPAHAGLPLFALARGDMRALSQRVSCDQDIASDGFFSLGMIAEFEASLDEFGPWFYRHLFWESGIIGQVLYLEAEAAGVRATGIGCFYDDPVHEILGLTGHAFQSLYHFTVGTPIDDARLTTEPGYAWE